MACSHPLHGQQSRLLAAMLTPTQASEAYPRASEMERVLAAAAQFHSVQMPKVPLLAGAAWQLVPPLLATPGPLMVVVALQAPLESGEFRLAVQASEVVEEKWIATAVSLPAREASLEAMKGGDS